MGFDQVTKIEIDRGFDQVTHTTRTTQPASTAKALTRTSTLLCT